MLDKAAQGARSVHNQSIVSALSRCAASTAAVDKILPVAKSDFDYPACTGQRADFK